MYVAISESPSGYLVLGEEIIPVFLPRGMNKDLEAAHAQAYLDFEVLSRDMGMRAERHASVIVYLPVW